MDKLISNPAGDLDMMDKIATYGRNPSMVTMVSPNPQAQSEGNSFLLSSEI